MRTTTVIGFSASFVFFASVAWRATEADIPADGALTRPAQHTMTVGPSTIAVDLDRGLVEAGGEVQVSLVGTADTARDVALDVTALRDEGMGGERVPIPPVVVGRRSVIVHAAPGGGAPTSVAFHLGHRAAPGRVAWFDVQVTPSKLHPPTDLVDGEDGHAAIVGVAAWTGNSFALAIEPPATPPATGAPFVVGVRVENTTKKPLTDVAVQLGSSRGGGSFDELDGILFPGSSDDFAVTPVETDDGDEDPLAPGASRTVHFMITPAPGVRSVALMAQASGGGGGALDVRGVDLAPADGATQSVAAK